MYNKLVCFILFLLTSCTSNIKKIVIGVKQPKIETEATITKWLSKENISFDSIYSTSPEKFYTFCFFYSEKGILFNKKGQFIDYIYFKGNGCLRNYSEFLQNIKPTKKPALLSPIDTSSQTNIQDFIPYSINQLLLDTYTLKGVKSNFNIDNTKDFILFLPATVYMGSKMQTSDLRKYIRSAKANTFSKIQINILNFDKQQWWGEEWCKKINIII